MVLWFKNLQQNGTILDILSTECKESLSTIHSFKINFEIFCRQNVENHYQQFIHSKLKEFNYFSVNIMRKAVAGHTLNET